MTMQPLDSLIGSLVADGTLKDFSRVSQAERDAWDAEVGTRQATEDERLREVHLRERGMALRTAGIGRALLGYEIEPVRFPASARNFVQDLIRAWQEREEQGKTSTRLLPNVVVTGARSTGKSSFGVHVCRAAYSECFTPVGVEMRGISMRWTTGGALCDLIQDRADVASFRRAGLLVVDDIGLVTPEWIRRKFENLLLARFYSGLATVLLSRSSCLMRGVGEDADRPRLCEVLPEVLDRFMDRSRGSGEIVLS